MKSNLERRWQKGPQPGFTKLVSWQKSYELVLSTYRRTREFPADERFGLTAQARRSAVSVPCNIAEGWGRGSTQDYLRFVQIARGSLNELQTQMWIASDLELLDANDSIHDEIVENQRLVNGLARSLMNKKE